LNRKGSVIITIIVVLIILAVVGFLGYKYIYPNLASDVPVEQQEGSQYYGFMDYSFENVSFKMPDTWTKMDVEDVTSSNSIAIKINPSSNEDFMYVWKYGYAFDSKTLAKEVISYNFQVISEEEVTINWQDFYNYVVSVDEDGVTRIYNTYAYVKDEIGYVFTLKCNSNLYSSFKDKFVAVVDSVEIQ